MRFRRTLTLAALLLTLVLALGACLTFLATRSAENEFPARGAFVHASPTELHYLDAGQGRPIVLLHGAFGAAQDFAATLQPALALTHRVLAFDRPGHGWSERVAGVVNTPRVQAATLHSALHALGIERPVVLGFSYGGSVALAWAVEFPDDLAALVLINPASHPWPGGPSASYSIASIPALGPLFTYTLANPIGRLLAPASSLNAFTPLPVADGFDVRSPVRLELTPARFRANCEDLRVLADCLGEQAPHYAQIRVPTLILASVEDHVASHAIHARALEREIPGAKLIPFSPAGHQLPYTHTAEVARDVLEFLAARQL